MYLLESKFAPRIAVDSNFSENMNHGSLSFMKD